MQFSRAVLLALLVLLVGLLQPIQGTNKHKEKHHHSSHKRSSQDPRAWSIFEQKDQDYCFDYGAQIASGYAPWISTQKAMTRMQCRVCFNIQQDKSVLRIESIRIGQRNQPPSPIEEQEEWNAAQIFDIQSFDLVDRHTSQKMKAKLQLPVQFQYVDGSVERLQFHAKDTPWSKNIKKAVLNLIQLNFLELPEQEEVYLQPEESKEVRQVVNKDNLWQSRTFTVNEATLEGTCETTYTILSSSPTGGIEKEVNITKTINFNRCQLLADVGYGFQAEPLNQEQWKQTQQQRAQQEERNRVIPKEKLDRSTTIRYVLAKKEGSFVLRRVESLSEYVMKSSEAESSQAMQTVACAELVYRQGEKSANQEPMDIESDSTKEESLIYNADQESLEKNFYMFGDSKFEGDNIPFPFHRKDSEAIVIQAEAQLQQLVRAFEEDNKKNGGIDTSVTIEHFEKLVEVMRMCSVEELKQLDTKSQQYGSFGKQQSKPNTASDLFLDALAVAATRNTIYLLAEKIRQELPSKKMTEIKAAQLLKVLGRGAGLPAPSDAQCDIILSLCESDVVQKQSNQGLKQSCWLTFGTMVGELGQQSRKAKLLGEVDCPMREQEQAEKSKMELYKGVLQKQWSQSQDMYEKMLALKTIGNAGLKSTLPDLKNIMHDRKEMPMVRIQAIDALRRLRHHLPGERIQSIVLPIYQDIKEKSEVRIAAYSMIMQTRPSSQIVDQVAFTMANEKSRDVQGFVYSAMKAQAQSPIPEERKRADHLRNVLKMATINEEQVQQMGSSRRYSSPVYSQEQQEGAFVNLVSVYAAKSQSALPSHVSFGLDTFFNGQFNRNALKVTLCQKDIERLAREVFGESPIEESATESETESSEQPKRKGTKKTEQKEGFFAKAANQLRSLFGNLKIKGRQQNEENQEETEKHNPYIVVSIRMNDVDVMMIPVLMDNEEHSVINQIKKAFTNTLEHVFSRSHSKRFQMNAAIVLNSRTVSLPTSIGMSLKTTQSMYILGQVHAQAQTKDSKKESEVMLKFHPNVNWLQTQKMETRMMTLSSGVQSNRAVAINLPFDADLKDTRQSPKEQNKLQLSLQVPQEKVRLLSVHSLPSTFACQLNDYFRQQNDSHHHFNRLQTVHNQQLQQQLREVRVVVGGKDSLLGVPIKVKGHFHQPRQVFSLKELLKVIMTGDNHLNVELDPREVRSIPKEILLTVIADVFQPHGQSPATSLQSTLKRFYSKAQKKSQRKRFSDESIDNSDEEEQDNTQQPRRFNGEQREQQSQRISSYLERFAKDQKRNYKHSVKLVLETLGGGNGNKLEAKIDTVCDSRLRACEASVQAESSSPSNKGMKLNVQVQTLYPEHVNDVQELLESSSSSSQTRKSQEFFCHIKAHWGVGNGVQEQVDLNIRGEPSQEMLQHILHSQDQKEFRAYSDMDSTRRNGVQRSGKEQQRSQRNNQLAQSKLFIDQYQMVVDYTLRPSTLYTIRGQLEGLKSRNFWNTKSKFLQEEEEQDQSNELQSTRMQNGQAECTINIDPITARHANVSIETPVQQIFIRQMEMPCKARPMRLVRNKYSKGTHSTRQLVSNLFDGQQTSSSKRAQCKVGVKTVDTFDGVAYKAPISKCYTLLAKDCSKQENGAEPKFAVLMRSLEAGSEQRKIKVIVPGKVISVMSQGQDTLRVKLNDKAYIIIKGQDNQEVESTLRKHGIEVETDYQERLTVIIDIGHVAVKFNGKTAKVQISEQYKNTQCGLCGNYNDDRDDELRNNQDELTDDVQSFHRSYALKTGEDGAECEEQDHQQFYGQDKKSSFEQTRQQDEVQPVERTVQTEYNHKICFSLTPVKQCPEGYYAAQDDQEKELLKRAKIQFTCLERQTVEAKRLRSVLRRQLVADLNEYSLSFVEQVVIPETCNKIQY